MLKEFAFILAAPMTFSSSPSSEYIGKQIITSYRSVPNQTDSSPYVTSIGEKVHQDGVAVSQEQLCPAGKGCRRNVKMFCKPEMVHYKDVVWIQDNGFKVVNDCMNARHRKRFDIWVNSYAEEYLFDQKYGNKKLQVYLIKGGK